MVSVYGDLSDKLPVKYFLFRVFFVSVATVTSVGHELFHSLHCGKWHLSIKKFDWGAGKQAFSLRFVNRENVAQK